MDAALLIAFNAHSKETRNYHGTVEEMRELLYLERHFADLINDGLINTYTELIAYMRKKWAEKWCPKILQP